SLQSGQVEGAADGKIAVPGCSGYVRNRRGIQLKLEYFRGIAKRRHHKVPIVYPRAQILVNLWVRIGVLIIQNVSRRGNIPETHPLGRCSSGLKPRRSQGGGHDLLSRRKAERAKVKGEEVVREDITQCLVSGDVIVINVEVDVGRAPPSLIPRSGVETR